jgi:16S rRNA processing protein RimM
MTIEACYKVGFITKPHGLKGEVTISLDPDSPANWKALNVIFIKKNTSLVPYFIESVSLKNDKAFLKLEEVSTAEEAEALKNHSLYLPKESRPKPEMGDFYDDEVIGFLVEDQELGQIGTVKLLERAGVNRFLIIDYNQKEIMIPVQHPLLQSINRSKKRIRVSLPDGFLDI